MRSRSTWIYRIVSAALMVLAGGSLDAAPAGFAPTRGLLPPEATPIAAPAGCSGQLHIFIGGVKGLDALADPSATPAVRASCRVGVYLHAEGWKVLDDATKGRILANFASTGPAVVELGYVSTPETFFRHFYKPVFLEKGVRADAVLVNGLCNEGIAQAKRYIDAARENGLKRVAVVFAPNSGQYKTNGFYDPKWACERDAGVYGGAIAIDAPPHLLLGLKDGYSDFIVQEIQFANKSHIASYYIVSPNASGDRFAQETQAVLDYFKQVNAMPSEFVFETYDIHRDDAANHVGTEAEPRSLVGVTKRLLPVLPR